MLVVINTREAQLASVLVTQIHMRIFIALISAKLITALMICVSPAIKTRLLKKITSVQPASLMLRYQMVQWAFVDAKMASIMMQKIINA